MKIFSKILLTLKEEKPIVKEQHITSLYNGKLTIQSYTEDFSVISVMNNSGNTGASYLYVYLDDTSAYIPFCYDHLQNELNIAGSVGGARYGIQIIPALYDAGTYVFSGGIKNISTGEVVQTFVLNYTK